MAELLFAAHPTVGHTSALVGVGRRLVDEGHRVRFAIPAGRTFPFAPEIVRTAAALPDGIRRAGLEVVPLRPSLRSLVHAARLPFTEGYAELRLAVALFASGAERMTREIVAELRRAPADAVVADFAFLAGWLAAELTGTPHIAFYHSGLPFPVAGAPPFGSGLALGAPRDARWLAAERDLGRVVAGLDRRVSAVRAALGMSAVPDRILERPYAATNLLATLPALELPGLAPGPRATFVGPCLSAREEREAADFPWGLVRATGGRTRVYVSLGTVFNARPSLFRAILEGLGRDEATVVVSAGASAAALRSSEHVHVFARVPQLALLEHVEVVVTHGGNNTVQETLAAGRPMLVVPLGAEQAANAARVASLGAGLVLSPSELTPASVRAAISRLRSEPTFAERARAAAEAVRAVDGTAAATRAILAVAAGSARRAQGTHDAG